MGKVIIQEMTTKNPIQLIGMEAGVCWGADTDNAEKNYQRGLGCLMSEHMRTAEFPQVYMILDGYSARAIRELYTHIAGGPTRLQASTRYINYNDFAFVIPPSIAKNAVACKIYTDMMANISTSLKSLEALGIPKEDCGMGLPLAMETKVVMRTNGRHLIDMMRVRKCFRAYWEIREMMKDISQALKEYSVEWATIVDNWFMTKCEYTNFCTERYSCGRYPKKEMKIKQASISHGKILGVTDKKH